MVGGMKRAPALEPHPGRPRDVRHNSCWVDHEDGTVSFVIHRRAEGGAPSGLSLAFHGATEAEAMVFHEEWSSEQREAMLKRAGRRAKWGPLGTGPMK